MAELRRVLLFGLSADPPTGAGGHLGLIRWAVARPAHPELGGRLDAIRVLPVYRHAYAEKSGLASYEDRVQMCRLGFARAGRPDLPVEVSRDEEDLARRRGGTRGSTLELIEDLEAREPGVRFGLLLGADTAADLRAGRWQRSDELLARVPLVIAPRAGVEGAGDLGFASDAPQLEAVSSSAARAAAKHPARLRSLVVEPVARYIESRGLYSAAGGPPGSASSV